MKIKKLLLLSLVALTTVACGSNSDSSSKASSSKPIVSTNSTSSSNPNTSTSSSSSLGNSTSSSTPTDTPVVPQKGIVPYTGDTSKILDSSLAYPKAENPNVFVHFYRFDENYSDWEAWIWGKKPTATSGIRFYFHQIDLINGKKWATVSFSTQEPIVNAYTNWDNLSRNTTSFNPEATQLGLIFRDHKGNKESEVDRFMDLSQKFDDGNCHVFLMEGGDIFYSLDDLQENLIDTAKLDKDYKGITINAFKTVDPALPISVKVGDRELTVSNIRRSADNKKIELDLATEFDLANLVDGVTVSIEGAGSRPLNYENVYDTQKFIDTYTTNEELGCFYTDTATTFKLWAPTATKVSLNLYLDSYNSNMYDTMPMKRGEKGVWELELTGQWINYYYTYTTQFGRQRFEEVVDPYAKAVGANGIRALITDISRYTDPKGFDEVVVPNTTNSADAIVYETHVRDFSNHETWNGSDKNRGKYLGMIEKGTTYSRDGKTYKTGFDYLTDEEEGLGINYIQLQPVYDFESVDEVAMLTDEEYQNREYKGCFNWGYDPQNYGSPEGSYSSNPYDAYTRVIELKQVSQAYNNAGIGIIMDVVFNHMPAQGTSCLEKTVPGYYFRGLNNSGAGADMASERLMYRKYMVDMCVYWAREYKLAGFRFDLMGLHDVVTMNAISDAVNAVIKENNPNATAIIYGEGWSMYSGAPIGDMATQGNVDKMHNVGAFNDKIRDAIRGGWDGDFTKGWASGNTGKANDVASSLGANYSTKYAGNSINYVEAHDNLTLFDKLQMTNARATREELTRIDLLSYGIVFTSQGTAFMQAGSEWLRTKETDSSDTSIEIVSNGFKSFNRNSYNGTDKISNLKWDAVAKEEKTIEAYKNMIKMRKEQQVLHAATIGGVINQTQVLQNGNVIVYKATNKVQIEGKWNEVLIVYNSGKTNFSYNGNGYKIGLYNYHYYGMNGAAASAVTVPAQSMVVLYR